MPSFLNQKNMVSSGGQIGIRPDPVPGVGINLTAEQFVKAAAGLTTVASTVNPFSLVTNYAISLGLAGIAELLAPEREQLVYLDSDLSFDKERPSRRIFGSPGKVGGWLLGAFTRDKELVRAGTRYSDPVYDRLLPILPALLKSREATDFLLLDEVIWLCEGALTDLKGCYINGEYYALEEQTNVTLPTDNTDGTRVYSGAQRFFTPKNYQSSRYGGRFYITANYGVDETNTEFARRYPKEWRNAYKAQGHSWVTVTLIDRDDYIYRRAPEVLFNPSGQKVSNLVTPGGADVFTDNYLSIEHWILSHWVEGLDASKVDTRSYQDGYMWARQTRENDFQAYQRLATNKPLPVQSTEDFERYPQTTKLGAAHFVLESATPFDEVVRRGNIIRNGGRLFVDFGKIKCTVGKNLNYAKAFRIDTNDLAGVVTIEAQPAASITFNTVRATLARSQADDYEQAEIEITDPVLLALDGGVKRVRDLGVLYGVTDKPQAVRYLNNELRTMRNAVVYRIPLKASLKAMQLRHNDPIVLTDETNNLFDEPLRVTNPLILMDTGRMDVEARYSPPDEKANILSLPDPNIRRFNETSATPPSRISVVSTILQTQQIDIAETTVTYNVDRFYPFTDIQWRKSDEDVWFSQQFSNSRDRVQRHKISVLMEDTDYILQLRNVTRFGEVSTWSTDVTHNPSHDVTPPPIVSGARGYGLSRSFGVDWIPVSKEDVPDFDYVEISVRFTERVALTAQGTLVARRVLPSSAALTIDVSDYFSVDEGVTYSAVSSNTNVVAVAMVGSMLTLTYGSTSGTSTVTVTALGSDNQRAVQTFTVTVARAATITGSAPVQLLNLPAQTHGLAWDDANQRILTLSGTPTALSLEAYDPVTNAMVALSPGVMSRTFNFGNNNWPQGMAFLGTTLYSVTEQQRSLMRFNAGLTSVSNLGRVTGLATRPMKSVTALGDTLYTISGNRLHSINPSTRVATPISTRLTNAPNYFSLAEHNGTLYTIDWEPATQAFLYTISTTTGRLTRVGRQVYNISPDGNRGPTSIVGLASLNTAINGLYLCDSRPTNSPFYRVT